MQHPPGHQYSRPMGCNPEHALWDPQAPSMGPRPAPATANGGGAEAPAAANGNGAKAANGKSVFYPLALPATLHASAENVSLLLFRLGSLPQEFVMRGECIMF